MPSAGSNNSSSAIETITDVDGGGKRGQNSGGLVTFHSAPFPLGRGCSLRTARSGQGRAGVARRSEPFTARTVLRSSTRGRSEEHTSELQSRLHLVCRLLLEKKKTTEPPTTAPPTTT